MHSMRKANPRTKEFIETILYEQDNMAGDKEKGNILENVNHSVRRFFRCWLDGSYNGYNEYQRLMAHYRAYPNKRRAIIIGEWKKYISKDFDLSPQTVTKAMYMAFTEKQVDRLTDQLVEDANGIFLED